MPGRGLNTAKACLRRAAIGLAAGLMLQGAAVAQQQGPDTLSETYSSWTVRCQSAGDAGRQCTMTQVLQRQEGGERLLLVEFAVGDEDQTVMALLTPFGLRVTDGATLQTDEDEPRQIDFFTCLPNGCIVRQTLGEPELAALRRGNMLTTRFVVAQGGEPFELQVSLEGFSAAYRRLRELST